MRHSRQGGFTVLEAVIVTAISSIFMVMMFRPMLDGLTMTLREQTQIEMHRTAQQSMNAMTAQLRNAILPMTTGDAGGGKGGGGFRSVINSADGFGKNGDAWREAFANGTDFLPFCVPVEYKDSKSRIDHNMLPVLGIVKPGDKVERSAEYTESTSADGRKVFSLKGNIHPALANLTPESFDVDPDDIDPDGADDAGDSLGKYAPNLTFPAGSDAGFAVIHFVPTLEDGEPKIISEAELKFDLNDDGARADSFAIGAIYLTYAASGKSTVQTPLTPPMVLMQVNTDAASYVPLFQLVGGFGDAADSPGGLKWSGATGHDADGYTLYIRMLLFDEAGQRTPFAFMRGGYSYLAYRFETMVTMRNMSRKG